jgi:NTE family protein
MAGAGARGAYEAGVLSVVLPRLAAAGATPELYIGTSAGAINATVLAATAERGPDGQGAALLELWRTITSGDVFRPVLRTAPGNLWRGLAQVLGIPRQRLTSLLDTAPLERTAARRVPWPQLRANVDDRQVALAVVTTAVASRRTAVLVDRRSPEELPPPDDTRPIDYLAARLTADHVRASAAIPGLFPAVRLGGSHDVAGWHIDGGVRLNAPLKPALALGADAVVVVATHPLEDPAGDPPVAGAPQQPDVDDALVQVLDAALVDRMVEDVRTLATVNELVDGGGRRAPGRRPFRVVPWLFFGPERRGTLGDLAAACFDRRYGHDRSGAWRAVRDPDPALLGRLLAGDGPRRGDLLSYLFFDSAFLDAAIELGRADAAAVLAEAPPGTVPWRNPGPLMRDGSAHGQPS